MFDQEYDTLKNRRAIANAMLQASMADKASGQMVSGHYVGSGLSNALGSLVDALASKDMMKDTDSKMASLAERKQAALSTELEDYMKQRDGQAGGETPYSAAQVQQLMQNDVDPGQNPMMPEIAANPRAAAIKAIASQFPQLQNLGNQDFADMRADARKKPVEEEWHDPKEMQINGKPGMVQFGKRGGQRVVEGASPMPKEPLVKVDMGQKVEENANKKLGEASIDEVVTSKKEAQKAQASYEYLQSIKPAMKQAITGFGADPKLMLTKLYVAFGGTDDGSVTTTEQLASALAQKVLDNTKTLGSGSGFTDKDREYLEKVVQGKLTLDPATLEHALNAGIADAWNKINGHQILLANVAGNKELKFSQEKLAPWALPTPELETLNAGGDARDFKFDPSTQRLMASPFPRMAKPLAKGQVPTKAEKSKAIDADTWLKQKGF